MHSKSGNVNNSSSKVDIKKGNDNRLSSSNSIASNKRLEGSTNKKLNRTNSSGILMSTIRGRYWESREVQVKRKYQRHFEG